MTGPMQRYIQCLLLVYLSVKLGGLQKNGTSHKNVAEGTGQIFI